VALRVSDVWKHYAGTMALKGVNLDVQSGAIHGLVGRNGAGKSTLVSIVSGATRADRGVVEFYLPGDSAARKASDWCSTVYQRPRLFHYLSVAENLFIGREEGRLIRWGRRRNQARLILQEWGIEVDPDSPISKLRVDERQMIELARAFAAGKQLIILDEPTAALQGSQERERLFAHVRNLRGRGMTFIYISHQLDEIFDLCDDVTVLRDGEVRASRPVDGLTEGELVSLMVGRAYQSRAIVPSTATTGEPVLELTRFMSAGHVEPIDLVLRRGEAVGLAGPVGSGAIALAETIAGIHRFTDGALRMRGKGLPPGRPDIALAHGIAMVSADRHTGGLLPYMSVRNNLSLAALDRLSRLGWVSHSRESALTRRFVGALAIQAASTGQLIRELSGGNQQKVMIARALACDPLVLILANPTVGIDIAVKQAIYDLIGELIANGVTLIVASEDELADVRPCRRVLVFSHGSVAVELGPDRTDDDVLAAVEGLAA
jgi:simple sugar transport system ATP-binding protein